MNAKRARGAMIGKNLNVGILLLYVIAVADTFGALLHNYIPIALVLRAIMVCVMIYYFLNSNSKETRNLKILTGCLSAYLLLRVVIDAILFQESAALILEAGSSIRLMYFPLLFLFALEGVRRGFFVQERARNLLLFYAVLIFVSLILGEITGLGGVIGGRGATVEGGKGFMIGANEVGLMLILVTPIVALGLPRKLRGAYLPSALNISLFVWAGYYVFTKSSMMSVLTAAYSSFLMLVRRGRGHMIFVLMMVGAGLFYLVKKVIAAWSGILYFLSDTFFNALIEGGVVQFLFRGRESYINAIFPQLVNSEYNWLILWFGAGEFYVRKISVEPLHLQHGAGTTFEMDFFDLFASHGLVGFSLYAFLVIYMLMHAKFKGLPSNVMMVLVMVVAHSFMAGHVMYSPQVTTLVVLTLFCFSGIFDLNKGFERK